MLCFSANFYFRLQYVNNMYWMSIIGHKKSPEVCQENRRCAGSSPPTGRNYAGCSLPGRSSPDWAIHGALAFAKIH